MKAHLTRRYWFSSSHRLHSEKFDTERNREIYGKCNNPHGHGHNYALEVTVSGEVDARTGMVCNLVDLDGCVRAEVIERFDHQNLNSMKEFDGIVPTTECLAEIIFEIVKHSFHSAHLERVRLEETANNAFEYSEAESFRP